MVPEGSLVRNATFKSEQLCPNCDRLDLSVDKFLIGDSDVARSIRRSVAVARTNTPRPKFQLNSGRGRQSLGTVAEIQERHDCSLCLLVSKSISTYSDTINVDPTSICSMEWEVDGRRARRGAADDDEDRYSIVSRRIRLSWDEVNGKKQEAYILLMPPRDSSLPNADANSIRMRDTQFLARDYDAEKSNQALIKSWLDLCETHHGAACKRISDVDRFAALLRQTSFGVIDVVRMQLCQLPRDGNGLPRYIALSYVWAPVLDDNDHRTLRSNVMQRIQPGGIEAGKFPRTIRDAIQLTRDLGLRYIWIDSLCIVQDSLSSWKMNAANMDLVYGNAYLTICAADGEDSNMGLAALDPGRVDTPLKAEYGEGLKLLVSRPSESVIRDSVWNQRAWTFQERILSPRCLVFADRRVYFQCRSSNMSLDIYPDGTGTGWSSDWKNSPLRTLGELETRPIWFYMTCVSLYTGRHLTFAHDILAAFDGVARLVEHHMHKAPLVHGLPASHFDLALLWEPLSAQKRRLPNKDSKQSYGDLEFPSWSWSGWMDNEDEKKGAPIKYKQETLEGCFIDVHEWLLRHTWISWFIRNANGDLRPIWRKDLMPEAPGVMPRWRGYSAVGSKVIISRPETTAKLSTPTSDTTDGVDGIHRGANYAIEYDHRQPGRTLDNRDMAIRVERPVHRDPPAGYDGHGGSRRSPRWSPPLRVIERGQEFKGEEFHVDESKYETRRITPIIPRRTSEYENNYSESSTSTAANIKDDYGRNLRRSIRTRTSSAFCGTIPDNPFGVNYVGFESLGQFKDQATLQFWTRRAQFYVLYNETATNETPPGKGLVRCDIADENGDWCGHIVLNEDWIHARDGQKRNFIAISDAKSFAREECLNWTHYIPRDPEDVEWDLFFVLLIEWNRKKLVWERVGLGKVFQAAFNLNNWAEILLG